MTAESVDIAIFGSTPLARLLAGLLASTHGRKVCLVAEPFSAYRLQRGIDLSVGAITRPETWAVLAESAPETVRILGKLGARSGLERVDPLFIADEKPTEAALSHVQQVALGFGIAIDRPRLDAVTRSGAIFRFDDAWCSVRPRLVPALDEWLAKLKLLRRNLRTTATEFHTDGTATLTGASDRIDAQHVIIADPGAALDILTPDALAKRFTALPALSLMTEPTTALPSPVITYVDRGVTLARIGTPGIAALAAGRADEAVARIGASLVGRKQVRRSGQAVYRMLTPLDGAPMVGLVGTIRAMTIAGFGDPALFFAPALARYLARASTGAEAEYFQRRGSSMLKRSGIAEFDRLASVRVPAEAVS
ncbi:MAG: hypothetical protein JWR75_1945 [Devosia sp.]|nr:hypothetical protein [Devosia sp.]